MTDNGLAALTGDRQLLETYIIRSGTPPLGPDWTVAMAALDRQSATIATLRDALDRHHAFLLNGVQECGLCKRAALVAAKETQG